MSVDWKPWTQPKGKVKIKKPKISEAWKSLQHAVVRGDQKEIERLRDIVAKEETCRLTD